MQPWVLILLILSVSVIVVSVLRVRSSRSMAPKSKPGSTPVEQSGPAAKGAPLTPNWNAIGAITGVLGLIVSVIGLFKG